MPLLTYAILVLLLPSAVQSSAVRLGNASDDWQPASRTIKPTGWEIPGWSRAVGVGVVTAIERKTIDGVTAERKALTFDSASVDVIDSYFVAEHAIKIVSTACTVHGLYRYEVSGKVFAYEVELVPTAVKMNGSRTYAGAMMDVFYYDDDGDGVFRTRYNTRVKLYIPAWALRRK